MGIPLQGQFDGLLGAADGDVDVGLRAAPIADHRGKVEDSVHRADRVLRLDQPTHIALHHPDPVAPLRRHRLAGQHQGDHPHLFGEQAAHQVAADEAARAGNECALHLGRPHSPITISLSQLLPSAAHRAR
ncbi:hypothetical protein D3C72_1923970 [compost metagenome]